MVASAKFPAFCTLVLALLVTTSIRAADSTRLYLGEIRFHASQQDYFAALVDLLSATANDQLSADDPEVLELAGRLQLGFGLYKDAQVSLDAVLSSQASRELQQQVWFAVATDAWQRGQLERGLDALAHIGSQPAAELVDPVNRLRAQMASRAGRFADSARLWQTVVERSQDPVAKYNWAVAEIRSGRPAQAEPLLRELAAIESFDEARRTLRDRAAFRLGLILAARGEIESALAFLESVRLHGPLGTRALLASGRILSDRGDSDRALVPWKVLRQRTTLDAAVQEAWVRIASTQYRQGRYQDAAYDLQEALDAFDRSLRQVDDARKALHDGRLAKALRGLGHAEVSGSAWMNQLLSAVPESRVLGEALAAGRFQHEFRVHREIQALRRNLESWSLELTAYQSMVDKHEELFAKRAVWIGEKLEAMDLGEFHRRAAALSDRLAAARGGEDSSTLHTAAERAWFDHLRRLESHLPELPAAERAAAARRIDLLRARVRWFSEIEFEARAQRSRRDLAGVNQDLQVAGDEIANIQRGRLAAPAAIERRRQQISDLRDRLREVRPRVEAVLQAQEQLLMQLAAAEIDHAEQGLRARLLEARTLLARNYDEALRAKAGERP